MFKVVETSPYVNLLPVTLEIRCPPFLKGNSGKPITLLNSLNWDFRDIKIPGVCREASEIVRWGSQPQIVIARTG